MKDSRELFEEESPSGEGKFEDRISDQRPKLLANTDQKHVKG